MSDIRAGSGTNETQIIQIRYWASARSAAGLDHESLPVSGPVTLLDVRRELAKRHPGADFERVISCCSVLVGDRPAGAEELEDVTVPVGAVVEFLPPFAGG